METVDVEGLNAPQFIHVLQFTFLYRFIEFLTNSADR